MKFDPRQQVSAAVSQSFDAEIAFHECHLQEVLVQWRLRGVEGDLEAGVCWHSSRPPPWAAESSELLAAVCRLSPRSSDRIAEVMSTRGSGQ